MRSPTPARDTITWSGCTSVSLSPGWISLPTKTERSRAAPVEKMADAATPGVGATTPFRRSPEPPATAPVGEAAVPPKRRAATPRSTPASRVGAAEAVEGGVRKVQVQYASCHASTSTSATVRTVPMMLRSLSIVEIIRRPPANGCLSTDGALQLVQVHIEVAERLVGERVLLVPDHPRVDEHRVAHDRVHAPRVEYPDELHHFAVDGGALG